jgi:hypothetical protein
MENRVNDIECRLPRFSRRHMYGCGAIAMTD